MSFKKRKGIYRKGQRDKREWEHDGIIFKSQKLENKL